MSLGNISSVDTTNLGSEEQKPVPIHGKVSKKAFIKQLLKETFYKGGPYEEEMKVLEGGLRTKSWIIHITLMLSRVVFSSLGQSYWQKGFETRKDNPTVRQDVVDSIETYLKTTIIVMIGIGIVLDFIVWKWRKVANVLIYYELFSFMIQSCVPFDYGNFDQLVLFITTIFVYM